MFQSGIRVMMQRVHEITSTDWLIWAGYVLAASLVAFPQQALSATSYFISQEGSDRNDGRAWDSAWRTIQHAAKVAVAGDTVIIRAGARPYKGSIIIANSGTEKEPITFRGEDAAQPPVITGGTLETRWKPHTATGIWTITTGARSKLLTEDGVRLEAASSPSLTDGNWHWTNDTLFYKPTSGEPDHHEVWRTSHGGGIVIAGKSWIKIQDIECRIGLNACVTIKNGNHNTLSRIKSSGYWRGVDITDGSEHNIVEDSLFEENAEGVYIRMDSSFNTVRRCHATRNGNLPHSTKGDRGGILIGTSGINTGNIIEHCEISFNGGPYSDPGLMAYQAPKSILRHNHVHNNYGSGIFVTISSHYSLVSDNRVEKNGHLAARNGDKGIAALSVRRSHSVTVKDNEVLDNHVTPDSRWAGKDLGPRGGIDVRGIPTDNMKNITIVDNIVSRTTGGPDIYIPKGPKAPYLGGLKITPPL